MNRILKVWELKELLKNLDDDARVLLKEPEGLTSLVRANVETVAFFSQCLVLTKGEEL